jgi:hypothetical protein
LFSMENIALVLLLSAGDTFEVLDDARTDRVLAREEPRRSRKAGESIDSRCCNDDRENLSPGIGRV